MYSLIAWRGWFLAIASNQVHTGLVFFAFFSTIFQELFVQARTIKIRSYFDNHRLQCIKSNFEIIPVGSELASVLDSSFSCEIQVPEQSSNLATMIERSKNFARDNIDSTCILQKRIESQGYIRIKSLHFSAILGYWIVIQLIILYKTTIYILTSMQQKLDTWSTIFACW